jgi:glutamate synthase (NADPH/NADH) large chain
MTGGTAVILGDTGRNFAAGMSGGVAYVWDKKGDFASKCNMEMVDLDDFQRQDYERLQELISNHYKNTKSDVAEDILNNWDERMKQFVKVMPRDYKAVLIKKKVQELDKERNKEVAHG